MTLDISGFLLEGVKVAVGNNPFTYPPRSVISSVDALNSSPGRADYLMFVGGQPVGSSGIDIGDPGLFFDWSRNNGTVNRFDYDSYSRRWNTLPGAAPEEIGVISNTGRLMAPIQDPTAPESPYSIYIGYPVRLVTFSVITVSKSDDFGNPPIGSVEISLDKGELNFNSLDVENTAYKSQKVRLTRQGFFDRSKTKGQFGNLPSSSSEGHFLFLNPIPGSGQTPRIRIGYRPYLSVLFVLTESLLSPPPPGSVLLSLDTGRVLFSSQDIDAYPNSPVYYDGVIIGRVSLNRGIVGTITVDVSIQIPNSTPVLVGSSNDFAGLLDPGFNPILDPKDSSSWGSVAATRFSFFLTPIGDTRRYYFQVVVGNSLSLGTFPKPKSGFVVVDSFTGSVYMSRKDAKKFQSTTLFYVDTLLQMEHGASIQVFRSGVNGTGFTIKSDFTEIYKVSEQVVSDGISQSPLVILPTIPTIDSDLVVSIAQASGSSSTLVGDLSDGTNPLLQGFGYLLDLDKKQLKFSARRNLEFVIPSPSSSVKLSETMVISDGLEISIDGSAIIPGVDFDFDQDSGLIEFVSGIGEDDPNNILNVSGTVQLPKTFISQTSVFDSRVIGYFVFFNSGPNVGLYKITDVLDSKTVLVNSPFRSSGTFSVDIRTDREIVADRFWTKFSPPLKKISVYRKGTDDQEFLKLDDDEFSTIQSIGQINLVSSAKPGDKYKVDYVWQQSTDNGVTVVPTPKTDFATFKVRQEQGIVTVNSSSVKFNPSHNTVIVSPATPITVYVENVTADPSSYSFLFPDTLVMNAPLGIDGTAPLVIIDYYVAEATGGESNFTLPYAPIDVDYPVILGRDAIASPYDALDSNDIGIAPPSIFNGNQTSILVQGGAVLASDIQVFSIQSVLYNSVTDSTTVVFFPAPDVTVTNAKMLVTGPISDFENYLVTETSMVDTVTKGGNIISVSGKKSYIQGMIFFIDGDPYKSISVSFNQKTGNTDVVIASPSTRNYILAGLRYTIRPVLEPGGKFQTNKPASIKSYPFTLVKDGPTPAVLQKGVDFNVSEGGLVTLLSEVGYGDILEAMYVYSVVKPAGTTFTFNYSSQIAPTQTNGIQGQKLVLNYNLYSPDTFFFRRESIVTFIPEVVDELKGSLTTGASSGPNIESKSSLKLKDMGNPSLYFNEQHMSNVDVVISRLLKFYNDLINSWEDILSDLDGRVVGGISGKFRFDGNLSNPVASSYGEITNDIDDSALIYVDLVLTGFFDFKEVPVYSYMYEPNELSRIFPIGTLVVAALNDNIGVGNFKKQMGSLMVPHLTGVGAMSSAPSFSLFTTTNGGTTLIIPQNGDPDNLIPEFVPGPVDVYTPNGSLEISATILSVTSISLLSVITIYVEIDTPTSLRAGSIVQELKKSYYSVGRDLNVNFKNGNIKNFSLPPPFSSIQTPVMGSEIIQSDVTFSNTDIAPRRIPVLDGSVLTDSGRPSVPPLFRPSETSLLSDELLLLSGVGNARVAVDLFTVTNTTFQLIAGSYIEFVNGPNIGKKVQIASTPTPTPTTAVVVHPPLVLQIDTIGSDFVVHQSQNDSFVNLYSLELGVLNNFVESFAVPPALIGNVNSELISVDQIILSLGQQRASGTGVASSPTVLSDPSGNFTSIFPPFSSSSVLYVSSGSNRGLYKIVSSTINTITISTEFPYAAFPSIGSSTPYIVIQPWSFVSEREPQACVEFLSKTIAFYNSTLAWYSSPTLGGVSSRISTVGARITYVADFISQVSDLLSVEDELYDVRYLWIQQRTDKKDGTISKRNQSKSQREENTGKLISNQRKLLIAESLAL